MSYFDVITNLFKKNPPPTQPTPTAPPPPVKKVLVVEDDQYLRDFYVELLVKAGFTVIQAVNGEEGLATTLAQKPDIVILDLNMPIMDGKTMLHKLREIPEFKTLPVIVLTNSGDVENIRETKLYDNASDFLIKSNIEPEALINKVKTFS